MEVFAHGVAGTVAGSAAMSLTFPLDTLKTHVQVESKYSNKKYMDIIKELISEENGGIAKLYQGLQPVLISLAASNFVYFYVNNYLKARMGGLKKLSTKDILFVAFVAGCINIFATNPFWVVSTRLRTQNTAKPKIQREADSNDKNIKNDEDENKKVTHYDGMIDGFNKIVQEEGVGALWNGTMPSLILVSNPTINYVTYDSLKNFIEKSSGRKDLTSFEFFILGLISKAVATLFTYPLQIAQSRIRNATKSGGPTKSTLRILIEIYQAEGFKGWFNGFGIKFLQTIFTNAFHMLCYEEILRFILAIFAPKRKRATPISLKK